jgi:hypothetical protein
MPTPPLDPKIQKEIYRLRQVEHYSIPEIKEALGVGDKLIRKHGGPPIPLSERKRKSALQQKQIENIRKNDEAISARTGKKIEDITEKDRREFIQHNSNKKANPHNTQLKYLRKFISRAYPEESDEILKNSKGGNKKLSDVLSHPIVRENFGSLIDSAISDGMDIVSGATKQSEKSTKLLSQLRKDMDSSMSILVDSGDRQRAFRDSISNHKAREYAYSEGNKEPSPENRARGRNWFDSLTPAEQVEAEGPMQLKQMLNTTLRTPEGQIDKNSQRVYHHKYELGQGYPHTFNQNDFEIISGEAHKKIHADPSYTGRPPLGPKDPGIVRRSIMNLSPLINNPVTKTLAKALPVAGYGMAAKAADDYYANDQPVLGTLSALQAVPVVGDVFGLPLAAAELGGLGINAAIDEYNRRDRKERAEKINLFNSVYSP